MSRKKMWVIWLAFLVVALGSMYHMANQRESIAYSPISEPKSILVYGDEFAMGLGASEPSKSFPALVAKKLGWTYETIAKPDNNSMVATSDLLSNPIPRGKYGIILLAVGVNDTKFDMPYETTYGRMTHLFELLYRAGALMVYAHVSPPEGGWTAHLQKYRAHAGYALVVENIMREIRKDSCLMFDDNFPNDAGHAIIADRIVAAIQPHIE